MHFDIESFRVQRGSRVRLAKLPTDDTGPFRDKEKAAELTAENQRDIAKLQQRLYAEGKRALLIVLQGMDASGKDGTVRSVFTGINPQGCSVVSFKAPSSNELAHDYLWRVHSVVPARGMIAIFNRSHYESVLVERVRGLVPPAVWKRRYRHINEFERLLADEGTTIVKFFLHISREEQGRRLKARLEDPERRWKYDPRDLRDRRYWNEYQAAYEDALARCSTDYAPWYIVPADHKWFRNWVVSEVIARTLRRMDPRIPDSPRTDSQG